MNVDFAQFLKDHIFDIVLGLLILLEFSIGAKKGLWKSLTKVIAILAAIFGSGYVGSLLYDKVYNFIGPKAIEKIVEKIESGKLVDSLDSVPIVGDTLTSEMRTTIETAASTMVAKTIKGILFIVVFFAIWIVLTIIFRAINDGIEALPIIRGVNKIGGAVIGAVYGLFWSYVICFLCGKFSLFTEQFENSAIASKLLDFNLIDTIISLFSK